MISAGDLDKRNVGDDSITVYDPQFTQITRQGSIPATVGGTIFTIGPNEIGYICNASANALLVKLGAGAAANSYDYLVVQNGVLKLTDYLGVVSVFNGTAYSYTAWKQS